MGDLVVGLIVMSIIGLIIYSITHAVKTKGSACSSCEGCKMKKTCAMINEFKETKKFLGSSNSK